MVHLILVCDAWKKGGFLNNIFEEKGPEKSEPKSKYNLETPNQKVTVATGKYTFLISGPSSGVYSLTSVPRETLNSLETFQVVKFLV